MNELQHISTYVLLYHGLLFLLGLCKRVKIPMLGKIESLNVSASSAIILYELIRQRN